MTASQPEKARTWVLHREAVDDSYYLCTSPDYCEWCFQEKVHLVPTERVPVVERAALALVEQKYEALLIWLSAPRSPKEVLERAKHERTS